ncbi:MAG: 50S ribosomal protein L11 methyltransferase [Paludibacteraceae bacterium]
MKYIVVHLSFDKEKEFVSDVLASVLGKTGFESFVDTENGLDAFIPSANFEQDKLKRIIDKFEYDSNIKFEYEQTEDKNWNEEWEKNFFEPIVIDSRCVVHSSFHQNYPTCEYDIIIDPKMAFGTGHHETTALMIAEILNANLKGKDVLDMGCGTSVLAILAEKRGACHVTAIDIDDWCTENSLENIQLNGSKRVEVMLGGAELLANKEFDMIFANINRNILLEDMEKYANSLRPNGKLLMSGFYKEDIPFVKSKATSLGFKMERFSEKNNWVAVNFCKNDQS